MKKIFIVIINLVAICSCQRKEIIQNKSSLSQQLQSAKTVTLNSKISHQKGTQLSSLDVISSSSLPNKESKVLIATLQGIVAKTSSEQIFIDEGGPGSIWKNYLNTDYNISINSTYSNWQSLLSHFMNKIKGYILYNLNTNQKSLTAATSLCGPMNAIAVDVNLEPDVRALGITNKILDVSQKDEKWVYLNYKSLFTNTSAAELDTNISFHLRDYITLSNQFTFYDGVSSWRQDILKGLDPGSFLYGYGNNEYNMVEQASQNTIVSVPSDLAPNLSVLSSIYPSTLPLQKVSNFSNVENKHYVCFVASDGDNIGWDLWGLNNYFSNNERGSFNMGYGLSPSLVDLAPAAMNWYYKNANGGSYRDYFIAGPSGMGYTFPSKLPSSNLDDYVERLNDFMTRSDMHICQVMDQNAFNRQDIWSKFLSKSNINGLFYFGFGESTDGQIWFSNNKPIIAQKDVLWGGLEEENTLINKINSRPYNPYSADGYTLVLVHVWTKNLTNIKTVINGLNPNIKVVAPDEFLNLITQNVKQSPIIQDGTYKILNYNSGFALDVTGSSHEDGTQIIQWPYNGNNNQLWNFSSVGNGFYKITSIESGKILEVKGNSRINGGDVDQWTANNGDNQLWQILQNSDGTYRIINKKSGYSLEVYSAALTNGAIVDQWIWGNATNQKWFIQKML